MCVFCKIVTGEIPSYKIYEDDKFLAFLDISQTSLGHTLVIPKIHVPNIKELDSDLVGSLFNLTVNLAKKITDALDTNHFNIINNTGELAGQSVFHAHVHIIPRYPKDNLTIKFTPNKLTPEEFKNLQEKIIKSLDK